MKNVTHLSALLLLISMLISSCQNPDSGETAVQEEDHMAWWRDARFGLFIHWGLYAIPAGEWNGERIPGISEWIMLRAQIPVAEYEALAERFNPVKYDADAWVRLAKEAGMKYIVITSKHHDGFAMFDSDASDYNIVDATPFHRDPLAELAEACREHDIKLGFYHSQAQDWHHPGGTYRGIEQGEPHWDSTMERVPLEQYIMEKVHPQVREILTNYGDIAIMWWDTPIGMTKKMADTLNTLLALQPGIVANNRLYREYPGDFSTPEQHVPPTGLDYDWETCMTMNTSWGYKHYDDNWKSTETLLRHLADIASKGGNFLLNVGPTAEGEIPQASIDRLKGMGEWMQVNGESIYGTTASPFFKLFWGRATKDVRDDGATVYLHVFDWPADGVLVVPGLKSTILRAELLATGQQLPVASSDRAVLIEVPETAPDAINSVIKLEIEGALEVESNKPAESATGLVSLPAVMGDIHNRGYGVHARLEGEGLNAFITSWEEHQARVEWMFAVDSAGAFDATALAACSQGNPTLQLTIGDDTQEGSVTCAGEGQFATAYLGRFYLQAGDDHVAVLRALREGWQPVDLEKLELKRLE